MNKTSHKLTSTFVSEVEVNLITKELDQLIEASYNKDNFLKHAIYITDRNEQRLSYAFILNLNPVELNQDLPYVDISDGSYPTLVDITTRVKSELGIEEGRILFNVQKYWQANAPIHIHRDGEVFDIDYGAVLEQHVKRAIHPKKVALLTLVNNAEGGGTRLHDFIGADRFGNEYFDDGFVVNAKAGDLLVFDNVNYKHSVDALKVRDDENGEGVIRMIVGWRPLENECVYYNKHKDIKARIRTLSHEDGCMIQRQFLEEQWIHMRKDILMLRSSEFET